MCDGEGEREGKKGDLGLGFTMTHLCVDDSCLWGSEGQICTENTCGKTFGIKFYATHIKFSFETQV